MSNSERGSSEDEEYFQPISSFLVHQWRKIRSNYPKNIEEEVKAKAIRAADLARIQKMNESRQNRRRGRESRIKIVDEFEDEEEERPTKRRKIAEDVENSHIDSTDDNTLPIEVIGMIFDYLDLVELYRHCALVSKTWNFLVPTKIEKSFERLSNELKEHTNKYPKYMKCQDYFTRIKKLMPQYNDILPLVYHRIRRTLATKKDKRELFTISVENAEDEINRKDRFLFSFESTGYVVKDQTVDYEIMPIGCSKLEGVPDLPPNIEWPATDGRSHKFLAQLRLDELSLFDVCGLLPWTTGMLYFFQYEKVIYYDGDNCTHMTTLAPRDHTGLIDDCGKPLKPELPAEVFFDLSLMRPNEDTWHRGRYFDADTEIKKKNCLHVLGYPEFDFETMPGFDSEEEKDIDQDAYQPEVPSTMLFGTISHDTFASISSRTYSWTLAYDDLAAKNVGGVRFEMGGD